MAIFPMENEPTLLFCTSSLEILPFFIADWDGVSIPISPYPNPAIGARDEGLGVGLRLRCPGRSHGHGVWRGGHGSHTLRGDGERRRSWSDLMTIFGDHDRCYKYLQVVLSYCDDDDDDDDDGGGGGGGDDNDDNDDYDDVEDDDDLR